MICNLLNTQQYCEMLEETLFSLQLFPNSFVGLRVVEACINPRQEGKQARLQAFPKLSKLSLC